MAQVLIRNLDDEVVARLKRKAEAAGQSLEAYLREIATKASGPSREEVIAAIDAIRARSKPPAPGEPTAADYVREGRAEREQKWKRLLGDKS